jgi:hypothetical protein
MVYNGHVRQRRGALNFVGGISKILFGTLDSNDANYYNEQIKRFEEESEDMAEAAAFHHKYFVRNS